MLDHRAFILHHGHTCCAGTLGGGIIDNAFLRPKHFDITTRNARVGNRVQSFGFTEYIDHIDLNISGYIRQTWVGLLAQNDFIFRINGDDFITCLL